MHIRLCSMQMRRMLWMLVRVMIMRVHLHVIGMAGIGWLRVRDRIVGALGAAAAHRTHR